jgi:hypothetical protein
LCGVGENCVRGASRYQNQFSTHVSREGVLAADKPEQFVEAGFFASGAVQ